MWPIFTHLRWIRECMRSVGASEALFILYLHGQHNTCALILVYAAAARLPRLTTNFSMYLTFSSLYFDAQQQCERSPMRSPILLLTSCPFKEGSDDKTCEIWSVNKLSISPIWLISRSLLVPPSYDCYVISYQSGCCEKTTPPWGHLSFGSVSYLICGVDKLDSFVGHGENDGWHLLHLFCRLLGMRIKNRRKKRQREATMIWEAL